MLPFKVVYSDAYYLPIGDHVFPAEKYRLIHKYLLDHNFAEPSDFLTPQPATDRDALLVHGDNWIYKLQTGALTARDELQMEIPFSEELVDAFFLNAGGSILAAQRALDDGICINLGGGFHHAFPDHGEGFCMINDIAIAIRRLQKDKKILRAMTVDCDVHHGNGTAVIFAEQRPPIPIAATSSPAFRIASGSEEDASKPQVFTISLHQLNNYPAWKPPSSIDVNLPDGTTDEQYLGWLDKTLSSALSQFQPELVSYVAGADPYKNDQLGGLALTIEGLKKRDEMVYSAARSRNIPITVTLAGGYAQNLMDTVHIHANTVIAAKEVFG